MADDMKAALEDLARKAVGADAMDLAMATAALPGLNDQVHNGLAERAKTWQDVERAALHSPLLYRFVHLVDHGYLTTEQALATLVLHLDQQQRDEHQRMVERMQNEPGPKAF